MQASNVIGEEKFFYAIGWPIKVKGRLKKTWIEVVWIDLKKCNLPGIWPSWDNGYLEFCDFHSMSFSFFLVFFAAN